MRRTRAWAVGLMGLAAAACHRRAVFAALGREAEGAGPLWRGARANVAAAISKTDREDRRRDGESSAEASAQPRPLCVRGGTRSEGWAWPDGRFIRWARCKGQSPRCEQGPAGHGWYAAGAFIVAATCVPDPGSARPSTGRRGKDAGTPPRGAHLSAVPVARSGACP